MKQWITLLLVLAIIGCKDKKVDLSGNAPVKPKEFVNAFPILNFPFTVADTNLAKIGDSTIISAAVLQQFVPDSAVNILVNTRKKYLVHPIGRIEKKSENYLLGKVIQNKKTLVVAFVFDKKNKFLNAKAVFENYTNDGYLHTLSINREPTFFISKEKVTTDTKQLFFSRVGWVYGSDNMFMVVMNDTNEDTKKSNEIINPIDTLPKANKLSGDYVQDKKNYISVRDGKYPNTYVFFIHFEKKKGTCVGELKGEFKMKDAKTAVYNQGGDPCVINFSFAGNDITLKEKGSCGNRRGMQCFFDDTFTKKKEAKTSKKKKLA
ncbi:MAG: hypothetical protein QM541_07910 [Flavobacterium sp.]|nr:hypothetical protein [Flavobacterium sp.]